MVLPRHVRVSDHDSFASAVSVTASKLMYILRGVKAGDESRHPIAAM